MKKYIVFKNLFIVVLGTLTVTFMLLFTNCSDSTSSNDDNGCSKSGACSGHGGVDCSAGADTDGSVICNDGWRDSTVKYEP